MKLSKKYKKALKKRLLVSMSSITIVLMLLAIGKLAGFSASFNRLASLDEDTTIAGTDSETETGTDDAESTLVSTQADSTVGASTTTTPTIASDGAIVCDSIVQGVRDIDLADGDYTFRVTGKTSSGTVETIDYAVELINYYDDVTYSSNVSLGDSTTTKKMLVVKYHKNLTINSGVTVTATAVSNLTYKKGMYLCVMGTLKNKGTISMTARGTYNQAGENVYLWKNTDNSFEYVPKSGGSGGAGESMSTGTAGTSGSKRGTGGGGAGGSGGTKALRGGNGSAGTSYSGGSGGGGVYHANSAGTYTGGDAEANGGAGGAGSVKQSSSYKIYASGGAGNTAGAGAYITSSGNKFGNATTQADNGTGGLLIIYSNGLYNKGTISSNGSNVTGSRYGSVSRQSNGGASGGGSVNIFTSNTLYKGTISASAGISSLTTTNISYSRQGSNGGAGTVTYTELYADLNYPEKSLELDINDTYSIDKSELQYYNQNGFQTDIVTLGSVSFTSLDESVAKVDSAGVITAVSKGKTKVKITDTTNNLSTYIYIEVESGVKVDVQEGENFTVALKKNGTVWSYGLNNYGQLGIGNNDNQTEPVQIESLSNVKAIATGYSHGLALLDNGEVYSWGLGTSGQLGNGDEVSSNVPVKVDGISNIVKIDAYKNISIALDKDGQVYVWGEDYSTLPMRVIYQEKIVDISGKIVLAESGKVYYISNTTTPVSGIDSVAKISCGYAHYLALTTDGVAYAWGTNTYGECGTSKTGTISAMAISSDIYSISAGYRTSIIQDEDGQVYVLGNNASGQIGLSSTSKATTATAISLAENVKIESISAGEETHSGLIDEDGFVWNTGLNTYGELGTGDTTKKTTFSQLGATIITTNVETKYLDIGESFTIVARLENTFNLKIDLIDDNQDNFSITLSDNTNLSLNNKTITALGYCSAIATVSHNTSTVTKDIKVIVAKKMESIVQGFRDEDLPDGEYTVVINDVIYDVELINYYDDVVYSEDTYLGDSSKDYKTLVVKYHGNLTINKGVTVTATSVNNLTYKKGMYLCVLGNIYNNGTISMTARGTYNQEGEDVYLWKNINDTFEYVPEEGGAGGLGVSMSAGKAGTSGTKRRTGGGGSGGSGGTKALRGGNGSAGTSYSGGSGGGGAYHAGAKGSYQGGDAEPNGGAGGKGAAKTNSSSYKSYASGGAGNTAGAGAYVSSSGNAYGNAGTLAENGTGGLLIIYSNDIYNEGTISSKGSNVNGAKYSSANRYAGGGASGGGSINIFANFISTKGSIDVAAGTSTVVKKGLSYMNVGGSGGDGSITINELGSILNYAKKKISLNTNDTYMIDKSKLSYTKLNEIQTEDLTVGTLEYESLDTSIATVDSNGNITAVAIGKTKIKITDTDNGYSTYIIVTVTEDGLVTPEIKEGTDFTVTLKANGTVWTYGKNTVGQLGNDTFDNSTEPVQVITDDLQDLSNIVDIGAGENIAIAVNQDGEVYTWGNGTSVATKVEGLSNIVKVDSYSQTFYAVDSDGNAYKWQSGGTPTRIETDVAIEDVSGKVLLGQDGRVYYTSSPTKAIDYLSNICEVASGTDHYLFVRLDGYVQNLGAGSLGQLGNGNTTSVTVPTLVKTEDGYLGNVASVSAGNKTSMAVTYDGKVYAWGDNTNKKLGIAGTKSVYATQVTSLQDKDGNEIDLTEMEIVETGENHSSISDKDGYVYSVGLNTYGQLGTSNTQSKTTFTKVGVPEIITVPENINITVNTSKEISIIQSNSFNLKTDIASNEDVDLTDTNIKEATIEKIEGVDNSKATNLKDFTPNYKITGTKIGRVDIVAEGDNVDTKNIWVNVVNNDTAKVSSKVVTGNGFTITLKADGTVWSFGDNSYGQLGLGDTTTRNEPKQLEVAEEIIDISAGENHVLLLGKSGTVYSFGLNLKGQLGTGNTTTYKTATKISLGNVTKVVATGNTSFAITEEGKLYGWGLGYSKKPALLIDEENVIDVGMDYYLADDGIVRTIGSNKEILLSLNEYDPAGPADIVDERIVQISEGTDHLLALGESGRVYSYGQNVYGQLGDGTTNARESNITTIARIDDGSVLKNIVEISAGDKYSIAVSQDGKVYTWGINGEEQLGYSNVLEEDGIQESGYAILKEDITNVERVSAGYVHTSVYCEDGNVYTWGQGTEGELGNGNYSNYWEAQLVGKNIVETNTNEILIEEEETFDVDAWITYFNLFEEKTSTITYEMLDPNMGIIDSTTGEIMALTSGRTTVLAKEDGTDKIAVISLRVLEKGTKPDSMSTLVEPQVETAGSHTVMLKVDGTVWTYGLNTYGELGIGESADNYSYSDEPVQAVFPTGTIITKIATGENHVLALDSNGNVWSWGRNNYYQLGNNKDDNILTPTKITSLSNITDIACGTYTSFAIGEGGVVYSFGLNANGECGIGSYTNKVTVTKAKYVTDAIDIKAGKNHTVILKSTGEVLVTGSNLYGELGTNSSKRKINEFTKVDSLNNVVSIETGDSNTTVIKTDGTVYSWGSNIYKELGTGSSSTSISVPTKVQNLSDIRYISSGKGYNLAINSNNEVFINGLNSSGELGNNTDTNVNGYTKLSTIDNVIQASSGNGYTALLKADGTVWATGDYTHGDDDIKSKTKSAVPIQVGNDETGLKQTEITLGVDENSNISADCSYAFNLIKLDENFADNLEYVSLNEDIATVNEKGVVTGKKVGTTRVNATSTVDNKVYSVLVRVVQNAKQTAPKIEAGENFAAVLKADGSVWAFGYNADGRLGMGDSLTKDIPSKTNILSTYEDIQAGKDFVIALREDGTVWSVGNNKNGQLGDGTTTSKNKLAQIADLSDIQEIEAGENFAIAIDKIGIVYVWGSNSNGQLGSQSIGNNILKPTILATGSQRIVDVGAGKAQSVFVTAKGTVFGYGNILNGTLAGIENAIKVEVTNDRIIILTDEMKVYQYKDGVLSQIAIDSQVINISANNNDVLYQTVDEKTYVSGENTNGELGVGDTNAVETPVLVSSHGENTFDVGVGYNNTYIIENTGNVYSAGNNEYGSIGNGTRESTNEYTLVGDRTFQIEPENATMYVGDTETIEITGNAFNVFDDNKISSDEYDWVSDDSDVVDVNAGVLTANAEGTAHITVTDKVTGESVTLTRIVIAREADRIAKITVNSEKATLDGSSTADNIKYKVQVVTNDNTGTLQITTSDLTDRISIDGGTNWSYNGTLNQQIDLVNKITEIEITVGVQNNAGDYPVEYTYILTVEKITDDIGIQKITATSIDAGGAESVVTAVPVNLTRYEVVVDENTNVSLVDVIANSGYSSVSIDGLDYTLYEQTKNIILGNELTKEVKIAIKSEAGNETEYTLVIYKKSEIMNLSSLKVNDKEATKVSEGVYAVTIAKDCDISTVVATVESNLTGISIANSDYELKMSTKTINTESNTTVVTIKTKLDSDVKEYTLYIYKDDEDSELIPKLNMLIVNGTVIEPESDKVTYIAYLPSAETEATIRAIAEESNVMVKIANNDAELADSTKTVQIPNKENVYTVTLEDPDGNVKEYTVIIRDAETDAHISKIYVSKGDTDTYATLQNDGTYLVKVPASYTDVDVTAITGYAKSKVQVADTGNYVVYKDTENVTLTGDNTQVTIKVQSEDGSNEEEYILNIQKMSSNTGLQKVEVDGVEATLESDGKYHYTLNSATNNVSVKAVAEDTNAYVKIDNTSYALYEITKQVDITAKQTEVSIKVKSENGNTQTYTLVVEGLPDDTTIAKVTVNGIEATYVEGKNRYEIRSEDTKYEIEVTLNDLLATMKLGTNEEAVGTDKITIEKTGSETTVKVVVTSQNGLETETYTIAILEKSNNSSLDTLKVNGNIINPGADGKYKATIKNKETQIKVEATAEDTYATTTINGTGSSYIATVTENVVDGTTIYNYSIIVVAEDGSSSEYSLEVEQLEANTNILGITVGEEAGDLNDATLQSDGTYYYKINRVSSGYVKIELESSKSTVTINGVAGAEQEVELPNEKNIIPIQVIGEDGTTKDYTLIIEKKSADTTIKSITGTGVIDADTDIQDGIAYVYIDEDTTGLDLTITLNSSLAKLKLADEENYEVNSITRTVDLSSYDDNGFVEITLNIMAEDGTEEEYVVNITKKANLNLSEVKVNSDVLAYDETNERYAKTVSNGNEPEIVITADNSLQQIQLLDESGTVLVTGTGTLTTTQTLSTTDLTTKYVIKVTSHNGEDYGTSEYDLWITQKSVETGITYVKVDALGTILSSDKLTYSSIVSGKEKYPVEIKLKDANAKVRIEDSDGKVVVKEQTGILTGSVAVPDGETEEFTIVVTSENGDTKDYTLSIERISSNLDLETITVTDLDLDGSTTITRNVVKYNEDTKIYKIVVNKDLSSTDINITAKSSFTNIVADSSYKGSGSVSLTKTLNGLGITEVVINLTAADGTTETRYLDIVQLSDEIGIQTLEVDGIVISPDEDGNYETTVTDENNLSEVKVTLPVETSKVSINGQSATLQTSTINVSKGKNRKLNIPIKVTAEDGTSYTYTLTLNIISHDVSVSNVKVDGEKCEYKDEKYIGYIGINETEASVEVNAGTKYSTIKHLMEDGTEVSGVEQLTFKVDTSDLTQDVFNTTFTIVAEDGTEKEYTIELIRKSDDATILGVYVDNNEVLPNSGNPDYADGTYYYAVVGKTAKVKVITNSEFATVSFNGKSGTQSLEQTITLSTKDKVTEIPVTITSQEGTKYETAIYIEKLSDNKKLTTVKVNDEEASKGDVDNSFVSYIYDTVTKANVEITAENENATIIRVTSDGQTYLDDTGASSQGKGVLNMEIPTPDQLTTIYFKIIAENGEESAVYTLDIEKMSTDATLKEIYVDGVLIEPNESGKYVANVLDTVKNPTVKAVTNHSLATVRIALNDESTNIAENTVTLSSSKQTIVPITVRSQSGVTKVTYLYLNKISTSIGLSTVTLDGKEADTYFEATHTYRFLIDDDQVDCELFVLADNDYTILEYNGTEYEASFRDVVNVPETAEGKTLTVKAKSEAGVEQVYTIEIARKSDNTNMKYIKVDEIERQPDEANGDTYTVMIKKNATTATIEVKTEYSYATVRLGDNVTVTNGDKGVLDCSDLSVDRIIVPVVVTAADGKTVRTYNIVLVRGSNNTAIELKVNNTELTADTDGNYSINLPDDIENIDIIATSIVKDASQIYASIDVNSTGTYEKPTKEVVLSSEIYAGKSMLKVPIEILAEDGTKVESILTITLFKGTYISGKITTENVNGEYISDVVVYRTNDADDIDNPREEVARVQTESDGTFKILMYLTDEDNIVDENSNGIADVLEEKYDIVVTKQGYLSYTVTNIEIFEQQTTELDEYKLLAGDVTEDGEIEISDLVGLNDKQGVAVSYADGINDDNARYDFNEDGIIDKTDRDILKANYSRKAETVEWVKPTDIAVYSMSAESGDLVGTSVDAIAQETMRRKAKESEEDDEEDDEEEIGTSANNEAEITTFILPMATEYTITSEYGYRTHPTTGEYKKHTGIDISGVWHTEIMAVAEGEVVFAGDNGAFGNSVEIKHVVNGETIYSFYAHLSQINVEVGQTVSQGEVIGLEGGAESDPNHGNSTGHHLHFEIRTESGYGNDVDPTEYIEF